MVAFILVHGTFVAEANWPSLKAALSQVADQQFEAAQFGQVRWTGKNLSSARESAARSIAVKVRSLRADSAHERIVIIGHSHGGSAICHFLKHFREEATAITGCAFLSTPFIAIRSRDHGVDLAGAAAIFAVSIAAMALFFVYFVLCSPSMDTDFGGYAAMLLLAIAIAVTAIFSKTGRFRDAMEERTRILVEQQTSDLPDGNYLFLRCSGDEAAAALSAAQFGAWLTDRFYSALRRPGCGIVIALTIFVGALIGRGLFQADPTEVLPDPIGLLTSPFISLPVGILIGAILIVFSGASWVFGWFGLFAGPLVQLAVEPIPYGAHSLIHIPWASRSYPLDNLLVHSWTYAHPLALEHLRSWVQSGLGKQWSKD